MAPPGGGKRKRGDRSWSGESSHDGQRPSPHRPDTLHLAQRNQGSNPNHSRDPFDSRERGGRQASRGGRGAAPTHGSVSGRNMSAPVPKPVSPQRHKATEQRIQSQTNGPQKTFENNATVPSAEPELEAEYNPSQRPFDFSFITDEACRNWQSSGRSSLLEKGIQIRDSSDNIALGGVFQELLWAGIAGRLTPSEAGRLIKDVTWAGSEASDADKIAGVEVGANVSECLQVLIDNICVIVAEAKDGRTPRGFSAVVRNAGIPLPLLRQELDTKTVERLGLVRAAFGRVAVRRTTNLLYRQANFNLLREESEGFAKLMTELFTTSGNEPPTAEVVEDTVERVKAMIGSFDLDVGRALDVVLDVFGAVLVKQFRFFVKFLRASPWWPREADHRPARGTVTTSGGLPQWALPGSTSWVLDESQKSDLLRLAEERDRLFWARAREVGLRAFFEVGRQRVERDTITVEPLLAKKDGDELSPRDRFTRDWVEQTGTVPPKGNEDAAQLLGFKLRFYSSSAARTENDSLPDNLIYLSALLIKVGFISLKDLYAHIWRTDDDMEALRQEKLKEKAERERAARPGQGAKNALLMAGALADDTLPAPTRLRETGTRAGTPSKEPEAEKTVPVAEKKDALPEPADQKIPLLKSLLAIGALPESLFILGKFPWIADVYPELAEYINRILHHALGKVYTSVRPIGSDTTLQHQKPSADSDITAMQKGHVKLEPAPPRKVLRWALLDKDDSGTDGLDYRFYWDEWSDNIPVCQTVDDVFTLCDTLVSLSGIKIGQDPSLLVKLARIGKHSVAEDQSEANLQRWIDLSKRLLIPALSLTKSNPGVVNEIYELLSKFTIETRYLIYQEWSSGKTCRTSDMKSATEQAKAETRDTLKRLSKTNVRPMARALAKIAYSNPHIVINTAISQIEVYDNLAEVFVEGARYFTDLGYDVLTWSLISALGRAGRSRVQESGLVTSRWLTALAYFAGKMFKRYTIMRPGPVLQYVTDQLLKGNQTDLIVLEQMILFMAGIVTDASYNDAQLLAMGGGQLLRSQTILQLLDRRHESRLTSRRLMRSLKESDLAGKLLLAISIQRQTSVFSLDDTDAPLKLLGNLYDEIHRVLTQYLDLLQSNMSPEEFEDAVPDVCELIVSYRVQPEVAFWISRPTLAKRITEFDKASNLNGEKRKTEDLIARDVGKGDVDMADHLDGVGEDEGEALETEPVTESAATPTPAEINGVVSNPESPGKPASEEVSPTYGQDQRWHPVLQPIMESIGSSLAPDVSRVIGLGFYVTFWQLTLYDVSIPGKSYEDELSRQHKRTAAISSSRADVTAAGASKREAEKKQIASLIDRLLTENKDHLKAFGENKARLSKEKQLWFLGMHGRAEVLNSALMEHCFLPRILLSPLDSIFCFKFLKFLHTSGTSNFRTMGFYDLLFRQNRLTSLIFMCTSREADNLGRFLNEILRDLVRWQKDKDLYEKEAWGSKKTLPGFAKKVGGNGKPETFLHYEDFRRLLYKWHQLLFAALQTCLSSGEYMHIRNAISVLKVVTENFPAINFHGNQLQKMISALGQSDQGDIKVPSLSLMADLNKAEKSWTLPQAFRKGQEKASEASESAPKTSTPAVVDPSINAKAADSKPVTSSSGDGNPQQPDHEAGSQEKRILGPEIKAARTEDKSLGDGVENAAEEKSSKDKSNNVSDPQFDLSSNSRDPNVGEGTPLLSTEDTNTEERRLESNGKAATPQMHGIPPGPEPTPTPRQPHADFLDRADRPGSRYMGDADARTPSKPSPRTESQRDGRDSRHHDSGPPGRYGEGPRELADNRSSRSRSGGRRSELAEIASRYPPQEHSRAPTRDTGGFSRETDRPGRDRPPVESPRARVEQERPSQERSAPVSQMAPPRAPPSTNTENPTINPERAALIGGGLSDRNGISIRGQGEDRPHRSSRPGSPQRDRDSRSTSRQEGRDERPGQYDRRAPSFDPRSRDRYDATIGNGGRNPFSDRGGRAGDGFSREPRHQQPQPYPHIDMKHGRLNQDDRPPSRPHHEQAPDRAEPSQEIPSGPRSRNIPPASHGPNVAPPGQAPMNQQRPAPSNDQPATGNADRAAPTGPAARSHGRGQSFQEAQGGSANQDDTSGVHPDRLALVSPSAEGPPTRLPSFATRPSPSQGSPPSAPSGPRGGAPSGAPSGPAPASRGPPSGPQANGRSNRHTIAAVINTLQQAGQGQSMRGRGGGGRPPGGASMPASSTSTQGAGAVPGPKSEVSIPPPFEPGRPDLFAGRGDQDGNVGVPAAQQDRDESPSDRPPPRGRRGDLMDEAGDGRRTSSGHSGRSRTRSPDADGSARRNERGYGSHRGRDRDSDSYRTDRDPEGRNNGHERDGDGGRESRRGGGGDGPERRRPLREPTSQRRDDHPTLPPPPLPPLPPPTAPQRRSTRRDISGADPTFNNLPQSSSSTGSQQQAGRVPSQQDERRGRRGYPSGPALSRGGDGNDRDLRERGRAPPSARESRDGRGDGRGGPASRDVRDSGDHHHNPHHLAPRKHPRADDAPPYSGNGGGPGGRGGNRMVSESKRARRGG